MLRTVCTQAPPFLLAGKERGGGVKVNVIFNFVFSLCNKILTSIFDLRLAVLVPPQSENASYAPVS